MIRKLFVSALSFLLLFLVSCNSVDSDAEQAAHLSHESIQYAKENKMGDAEKAFNQSQEIVKKYKDTEEYEAFYEAYTKYLFEEKLDK